MSEVSEKEFLEKVEKKANWLQENQLHKFTAGQAKRIAKHLGLDNPMDVTEICIYSDMSMSVRRTEIDETDRELLTQALIKDMKREANKEEINKNRTKAR